MDKVSQTKLANKYKSKKLSLMKTKANIRYNKQCLKHHIIPKYVNIKTNSNSISAQKAISIAKKVWIKEEIKQLHRKKEKLNKQLYDAHLELAKNTSIDTTIIMDVINEKIKPLLHEKEKAQQRKLVKLIQEQVPKEQIVKCDHVFHERVVNKSEIEFNKDELDLLNKGLKYNLYGNDKQEDRNTLLDLESTVRSLPLNTQDNMRHTIVNKFNSIMEKRKIRNKRSKNRHKERLVAKKIKEKLSENKTMITKADKGNTIVIMKESEYNEKVVNFIESNNIDKLHQDPTAQYQKKINESINKTKQLFTNEEKRYLKVLNPKAPKLRGLPKIHKVDMPIRPLVNFQSAPAYKLAKRIDKIIKASTELKTDTQLRNSIDLIDRIHDISIPPSATLVSFDIVNLYTNVPVQETLQILRQNLEQANKLNPEQIKELISLTELILSQNYFEFDHAFYKQNEGLAMGSPLSSILAELFLDNIEHTRVLNNNRYSEKIIYWKRYVDDVICLYKGNSRQINIFCNYINRLHPNLRFTQEIEQNNRLNYLDITISTKDQHHRFNIYRKPTHTDQVIHSASNHPYSHKMAAFRFMLNRLTKIPLSQKDYDTELQTIKYIAQQNGYKISLIDNMYRKMLNKTPTATTDNTKFVTIEYSNTAEKIASSIYKDTPITIAYRTNNNLSKVLKPTGITTLSDKTAKQGVYKINCGECDSYYIGQTGRSFAVRYKEHIKAVSSKQPTVPSSNFAAHIRETDHAYRSMNEGLEVLHLCKKSQRLDRLEEMEIYKAKKRQPDLLINAQINFVANTIYDMLEKTSGSDM